MVDGDDILAAHRRIRDRVEATPTIRDHGLSERLGRPVHLKCELFQRTGAFKPRGALNWVRTATRDELAAGLAAVSAGNHAAALAWAAATAGASVTVVMPQGASTAKVEATRALGAEVILCGDINAAWKRMEALVAERGLTLVHPFDDPRVIAGQGTVGLEIGDQMPGAGAILCPVGGGGLVSGLAIAVKQRNPAVRVIGVEPEGAAALAHAWRRGGPARLGSVTTCAGSLAPAITGDNAYRLSRAWVDELVTVPEATIARGVRHLLGSAKLHAEPGAAVGAGALLDGTVDGLLPPEGEIVAVVTGGNMAAAELRGFLPDDPG
ncbi:threonine/serine dehydratase [Aquisalimonas lutea]|uniref:threonine/serine dehydratase n=1 Tax=Aquisalimonas lutea TaxID=1327750 RepID=UPI0025B3596D|nr:threonine/serine dehydratase [Aquisalimonas lutea]MDN3516508.1 threonine/serine dehydratase [Aquisalimonas lutea]